MKRRCLTFLFLLIVSKLFSQTVTLLDSVKKEPVVGATVVVFDASTNALINQAVSNSNGRVSFIETNQSRYVSVTAVGYKKVVQLFKDSLQTIFLVPLSRELKQVTVKSNRSPIKIAGNVMEFDISQVPNADYMNIGEIIEQLPFLQIVDNNIRMMNENLVILIDNRPNSIYKDAASLKSLPPHAIDKMEVVLTPTARNGGKVLNITLKRDYFLGWNSTVSSSGNRLGVSPSASMTYWRKKAGFDLSLSYNNGFVNGSSETNINYITQQRVLNEDEKSKTLTNSGRISASSYYNLSEKDAIDLQFNFGPSKTTYSSSSQIFTQSLNNSYADFSEISRKSSARGYVVGLNYTHKYRNSSNVFYLLTRYSKNATSTTQGLESSSNGMAVLTSNRYDNEIDNSEGTIEIIQQQNSGKKLRYVIGSKLIFRDNGNDNTLITSMSTVNTIVKMTQLVSSSYVDADWTFSKFTAHTGLRLDYNKNHYSRPLKFQQSFTNLTPTVSLSYNVNKTQSFMLSYVRRVLRPSFYYTDPVVNPVNAYEKSGGSTDLQNQINNEWGLQYYGNYKFGSLGFSLNYSRTGGLISTLSTLGDDNVIRTTSANIGLNESYTVGFSANFKLLKKINFSHQSNYSYLSQRSGVYSNSRWSGYISDRATFQINKKSSLNINGTAFSPNVNLQGVEQSMAYLNWGLGYSYYFDISKNLPTSISVSLSNPNLYNGLPSYITVNTADFIKRRDSERSNAVVSVSFRIQFKGKQFGNRTFNRDKSIQNRDLAE